MKSRQQGIALITVLFTLALLTIMAVQIQAGLRIDIERTAWLHRDIQAREYALGAEQLAREILWQDRQELLLAGLHRSPLPGPGFRYHPPHGDIHLRIVDLQGLVNLNNFLEEDGLSSLPVNYLRNFLNKPEIEPLIRDWIDRDNTPLPGGAEDGSYELQGLPFRSPNLPMVDPSEIIIPGNLDHSNFSKHHAALVTLPLPTPINVNTVPEQLVTLIHAELSPEQFRVDRSARGGAFDTVSDFLQSTTAAGIDIDTRLLTVNSAYFAIHSSARIDGHWYYMISRVRQDPNTGRIELIDRISTLPDSLVNDMEHEHGAQPDSVF